MSLLDPSSMPHECTIRRRIRVKGKLGGATEDFAEVDTEVPCWQQKAKAQEIDDYDKRDIKVTTRVYFLEDRELTGRHQIVITKNRKTGKVFDDPPVFDIVESIDPDATSGFGLVYKYMANRVYGVSRDR